MGEMMLESSRPHMDESSAPGFFVESTVMPVQFFGRQSRSEWEGERRLMLAILEEAIHTFCKACLTRHRITKHDREAEGWIFSDDRSWCFSFENICEALDIDSEAVRQALLNWKMQHLVTHRELRPVSPAARMRA